MGLKEIVDKILMNITLEGLGLILGIGAIGYLLFSGSLSEIFVLFSQVFCG